MAQGGLHGWFPVRHSPYSIQLVQEKVNQVLNQCMTPSDASRLSGGHPSTRAIQGWVKSARLHGLIVELRGRTGIKHVHTRHADGHAAKCLKLLVEESESHTLKEFARDMITLTGDLSWRPQRVHEQLKAQNYSRVKVTMRAREQSAVLRQAFRDHLKNHGIIAQDLLCCDEMAMDRKAFSSRYAYVKRGQRSKGFSFHLRGVRYTILAAISIMGVQGWRVFDGSAHTDTFMEFYKYLANRMPDIRTGTGNTFLCDNASIHSKGRLRKRQTLASFSSHPILPTSQDERFETEAHLTVTMGT